MLNLRYSDVVWSIPILFNYDILGLSLLTLLDKQGIDYKLELCGAPICEWNSKIFDSLNIYDENFVKRTIDCFNLKNIKSVISFDKYDISGKNLNDEICNSILKIAVNSDCRFIISSDKLFKYIKKKYTNAYTIYAPFEPAFNFKNDYEKELKFYNHLLKFYDRIILRPEFVKTDYINKLNDFSKVEIIVNYPCVPNCYLLKKHINFIGEKENNNEDFYCCKDYINVNELDKNLFLSFDEINYLYDIGVRHFKILPANLKNSNILLMNLISYIFKENPLNNELYKQIILNSERVNYFYTKEILKNSKVQYE